MGKRASVREGRAQVHLEIERSPESTISAVSTIPHPNGRGLIGVGLGRRLIAVVLRRRLIEDLWRLRG